MCLQPCTDDGRMSLESHWSSGSNSQVRWMTNFTVNATDTYESHQSWIYLWEYRFGTRVFILGKIVERKKNPCLL